MTIANMKNNKAPGPDNVTSEQLKYLDDANMEHYLTIINRWWDDGKVEEELELAHIISI